MLPRAGKEFLVRIQFSWRPFFQGRYLLLTNTLSGGGMLALGDILQQSRETRKEPGRVRDWKRTGKRKLELGGCCYCKTGICTDNPGGAVGFLHPLNDWPLAQLNDMYWFWYWPCAGYRDEHKLSLLVGSREYLCSGDGSVRINSFYRNTVNMSYSYRTRSSMRMD